MAAVEGDQGVDVDVRQAVAVGDAEQVVVVEVAAHALDAGAGHGVEAGVDERDAPVLAPPAGGTRPAPAARSTVKSDPSAW